MLAAFLVAGIVAAVFMALFIGANDVANSMGAALGSKVLSLRNIIILAAVFELFGALFLGSQVSSRISTGLFTISHDMSPNEYMLAMICVLIGSGLWISVATCFSLPISTTHSIIGSIIVLGLYVSGWSSLNLLSIGSVFLSWIVSPILGAIVGYLAWKPLKVYVMESPDQTQRMILVFPYLIGGTTGIMILFIMYMIVRHALNIDFPFYLAVIISAVGAILITALIRFVVMPLLAQRIQSESERGAPILAGNPTADDLERYNVLEMESDDDEKSTPSIQEETIQPETTNEEAITDGSAGERPEPYVSGLTIKIRPKKKKNVSSEEQAPQDDDDESLDIEIGNMIQTQRRYARLVEQYTFNVLVLVTSCCIAVAHGSNDIANCNGPLQALVVAYTNGRIPTQEDGSPFWTTFVVSFSLVIGLALFGYKVMQTIGASITELTAARAFVVQICTSTITLASSLLGLPLSTTHIVVGCVLGVSIVDNGIRELRWRVISNIVMSWIVTIPFSGIVSFLSFVILRAIFI